MTLSMHALAHDDAAAAGPAPAAPRAPALLLDPSRLPSTPWSFILCVVRGHYRLGLAAMALGEALHAGCGILLPYALSRIITAVTAGAEELGALSSRVSGPVLAFAALCAGEAVFGRINAAIQLRLAPRQRHYIARALFEHLQLHSHRFFSENFAGALAHRISEVSHGTNQVLWAALTEFWPIAIVIAVS